MAWVLKQSISFPQSLIANASSPVERVVSIVKSPPPTSVVVVVVVTSPPPLATTNIPITNIAITIRIPITKGPTTNIITRIKISLATPLIPFFSSTDFWGTCCAVGGTIWGCGLWIFGACAWVIALSISSSGYPEANSFCFTWDRLKPWAKAELIYWINCGFTI